MKRRSPPWRVRLNRQLGSTTAGTNDTEKADELAAYEEFFVVDSETGEWLNNSGSRMKIEESK